MKTYKPKPPFVERMKLLLNNQEDLNQFLETTKTKPKKSIRVNTLKISPEKLKQKLEKKNWKINQPIKNHPEIFQIESKLKPGELGNSLEHRLGYYYVQEITSMMPVIALNLNSQDIFLDLCASPGSKTTQAISEMKNKGIIIANDLSIQRAGILNINLERYGATNTLITKHPGIELCQKLKKLKFKFNKILVDTSCSGEGNIRTNPKTYLEWSEGQIKSLSRKQKQLVSKAVEILKPEGTLLYSTCTYSPEENEEVIQHLIENYPLEIQEIKLPIKTRPGITKWKNKTFHPNLKKAIRIYHHDNNMEGFFLCKMKKLKETISLN